MISKKKVHIVLSSFGFWGEELVAPMEEFDKAGITYDFSTPYGHPPEVVPVSMDPNYIDPPLQCKVTSPEMAAKVKRLVESNMLRSVKKVSDVKAGDYDALLLVGGSGPLLDMNNAVPCTILSGSL
ncbi:MAG: type 1 glutamine amidotransferase domain-containing protein [Nitrospirota bacterium]